MEINLQMLGIPHDPQSLLGSCQRHVQSLQVGEKAHRFDGLRVFQGGSNARKNDDVAFAALKRVHRADFDQFQVFFELCRIDDAVHSIADLMHLRGVGRNDADGVADGRGRELEEESVNEIDDDFRFAEIVETGSMLGADSLDRIEFEEKYFGNIEERVGRYGGVLENVAEGGLANTLAVDELALIDVLIGPERNGRRHSELNSKR